MKQPFGYAAATIALLLTISPLGAQNGQDSVQAHVDAAKAAAGTDHPNLFNQLCVAVAAPAPPAAASPARGQAPAAAATPDRSQWHAEPAKVFDNLYFVGQSEYSAWAVTTSAGI